MSSPEERRTNDLKVDFIIKEAAGSNQAALEYLHLMASAARIVDDIQDELKEFPRQQLMKLIEYLFVLIPGNIFYRNNEKTLFGQHIILWNTWQASNILENGDLTDKIYAHVLRDYINELLPLVAFLTQGHSKMKEVNVSIRKLFKKQLGE
jgi:hypothetical protein